MSKKNFFEKLKITKKETPLRTFLDEEELQKNQNDNDDEVQTNQEYQKKGIHVAERTKRVRPDKSERGEHFQEYFDAEKKSLFFRDAQHNPQEILKYPNKIAALENLSIDDKQKILETAAYNSTFEDLLKCQSDIEPEMFQKMAEARLLSAKHDDFSSIDKHVSEFPHPDHIRKKIIEQAVAQPEIAQKILKYPENYLFLQNKNFETQEDHKIVAHKIVATARFSAVLESYEDGFSKLFLNPRQALVQQLVMRIENGDVSAMRSLSDVEQIIGGNLENNKELQKVIHDAIVHKSKGQRFLMGDQVGKLREIYGEEFVQNTFEDLIQENPGNALAIFALWDRNKNTNKDSINNKQTDNDKMHENIRSQIGEIIDAREESDNSIIGVSYNADVLLKEFPEKKDTIVQAMEKYHREGMSQYDIYRYILPEQKADKLFEESIIANSVHGKNVLQIFEYSTSDMSDSEKKKLFQKNKNILLENSDYSQFIASIGENPEFFGKMLSQQDFIDILRQTVENNPTLIKGRLDDIENNMTKHNNQLKLPEAVKRELEQDVELAYDIAQEGVKIPRNIISVDNFPMRELEWKLYFDGINEHAISTTKVSDSNTGQIIQEGEPLITINQKNFNKVFFSDAFQKILEAQSGKMTHMNAISLTQATHRYLINNKQEINNQTIKHAAVELLQGIEENSKAEIMGPNTKLILFAHKEDRFDPNTIINLYKDSGGKDENIVAVSKGVIIHNGKNIQKETTLDAIRDMGQGEKVTILFSGHGSSENWAFEENESNNLNHKLSADVMNINYKELTAALQESGNIQNVNILGMTCHAYDYISNMKKLLKEKGDFPAVAISAANKDRYGYGSSSVDFSDNHISDELLDAVRKKHLKGEIIDVEDFLRVEGDVWKLQDPAIFLPDNSDDDKKDFIEMSMSVGTNVQDEYIA